MKIILTSFFAFCMVWNAQAQKHAQQGRLDYINNYYTHTADEIVACEKGDCSHKLRLIEFSMNKYDTCSLGKCDLNKVMRFWYKLTLNEKNEPMISPQVIEITDKSLFWENQIFMYEGGSLLYNSFDNPFEQCRFYWKDTTMIEKNEFFKPLAADPKLAENLKAYTEQTQVLKTAAYLQEQHKYYLELAVELAKLNFRR